MIRVKRFLKKTDGRFVLMSDESRIPVASRKQERLMEMFERL